jgi:hypothetical protein
LEEKRVRLEGIATEVKASETVTRIHEMLTTNFNLIQANDQRALRKPGTHENHVEYGFFRQITIDD